MEKGSEYDDWATLHQLERCAETHDSAAGCRGRGGTVVCPQTTGMKRRQRNTGCMSTSSSSSTLECRVPTRAVWYVIFWHSKLLSRFSSSFECLATYFMTMNIPLALCAPIWPLDNLKNEVKVSILSQKMWLQGFVSAKVLDYHKTSSAEGIISSCLPLSVLRFTHPTHTPIKLSKPCTMQDSLRNVILNLELECQSCEHSFDSLKYFVQPQLQQH